MKLKLKGKKGERTQNMIQYHGRTGYPVIHATTNGRRYVMVRKAGGGVKRLYEGSEYSER